MGETRNEFKIECEKIINSDETMEAANNELIERMNQIINYKYADIIKLIKQLEKETGKKLEDLKLYVSIKKNL